MEQLLENEDITTIEGINRVCEKITDKEKQVDFRLEDILSRQCHLESKLFGIGNALTQLKVTYEDAQKLSDLISHTAELAETVSAKVRRLDEARSRVSECQQRVHDLIDLQLCSEGVIAAIKEEDYEKGAAHVHRFLCMDQTLLKRTADDVSAGSVVQAVATLEEATTKIRQVVRLRFEEAVKKDDLASVERFFKIYPLLGMHDEGIEKFVVYICEKLQVKAQKELRTSLDHAKADKRLPVAFADTLTVLLENLARVVEVNQPLVETYYGAGRLVKLVTLLQKECDEEMTALILEFNKARQIGRRTSQITEYNRTTGNPTSLGHYRKPSDGSADKLNAKDIDALIGEITVMHQRTELYIKFIRKRVRNDLQIGFREEEEREAKMREFEKMVLKSGLKVHMQELLGTYLLLERYFMEESVLKAISLDSYESGQQYSSMVDDVFFIVRKSIRRAIGTHSLDGICAVINNAASCLDQDFLNALKTPLKSGYPSGYIDLAQAYNAFQTSIQQGRLQTSGDAEHSRQTFIRQLNNADKSTEFVETLWQSMGNEVRATFPALTSLESEKLDSCLAGLRSFGDSLKAVIDYGMQQLRSSAIKPRLHPWVDQFLQYNHNMSEEELAVYEAGETFVQYLIIQLDQFLSPFKTSMSQRNYEALVDILSTDVIARLERAIRKTTFNRIGGLVLDQEIRAFGSYLTSTTSWSVREKLARLTQTATLLNLETVAELKDFYNPAEEDTISHWRLTSNEIRTILALRTDFRLDDIKKLKI